MKTLLLLSLLIVTKGAIADKENVRWARQPSSGFPTPGTLYRGCNNYHAEYVDGFSIQFRFQTVNVNDRMDRKDHALVVRASAEKVEECSPSSYAPNGVLERVSFSMTKKWTLSLADKEQQIIATTVADANQKFIGHYRYDNKRVWTWTGTYFTEEGKVGPLFYLDAPYWFLNKLLDELTLTNFKASEEYGRNEFAFLYLDSPQKGGGGSTHVVVGTVERDGKKCQLLMLNSTIAE